MQANQVMRQLSAIKEETESWLELNKKVNELDELIDLSLEEDDTSLDQGIRSEVDQLASQLDRLEFHLLFGGEYDKQSALLAIHSY